MADLPDQLSSADSTYPKTGLRVEVMFLCRGQPAPPPTSWRVWGSAVYSPSGVWGRVPAAKRYSCILEAPYGLSLNLVSHVPCSCASSRSQLLQQTFSIKFILFSWRGVWSLPRLHPSLLQNLASEQVFCKLNTCVIVQLYTIGTCEPRQSCGKL